MSLKAFHLVFIVASILLCAGVAAWGFMDYLSPMGTKVDLAVGCVSVLAIVALICYERYFLKKLKNVSYL